MSHPNIFGALTRGVQNGVNGLMSVGAVLQDSSVRQKAGELLLQTAKNVLRDSQVPRRRHRRKLIHEESQCDMQVGDHVYERVPLYMRTQLWKSLLIHAEAVQHHPEDQAPICNQDQYDHLMQVHAEVLQGEGMGCAACSAWDGSTAESIYKDLRRTFPGVPLFHPGGSQGQPPGDGLPRLWRILRVYSLHDPELGYCQGMNFVAGLLLLHLDEPSAFAALTLLLSESGCGLRGMYLPSMELLQLGLRQLDQLLHIHHPCMHLHLQTTGAALVIFTSPWLLSLFSSEFPMNFSGRVMDMILAERTFAVIMRVALCLLLEASEEVMEMSDFEDLIGYFKQNVPAWDRDRLNKVLTSAGKRTDISDTTLKCLADQFAEEDAAASTASSQDQPHPDLGPTTPQLTPTMKSILLEDWLTDDFEEDLDLYNPDSTQQPSVSGCEPQLHHQGTIESEQSAHSTHDSEDWQFVESGDGVDWEKDVRAAKGIVQLQPLDQLGISPSNLNELCSTMEETTLRAELDTSPLASVGDSLVDSHVVDSMPSLIDSSVGDIPLCSESNAVVAVGLLGMDPFEELPSLVPEQGSVPIQADHPPLLNTSITNTSATQEKMDPFAFLMESNGVGESRIDCSPHTPVDTGMILKSSSTSNIDYAASHGQDDHLRPSHSLQINSTEGPCSTTMLRIMGNQKPDLQPSCAYVSNSLEQSSNLNGFRGDTSISGGYPSSTTSQDPNATQVNGLDTSFGEFVGPTTHASVQMSSQASGMLWCKDSSELPPEFFTEQVSDNSNAQPDPNTAEFFSDLGQVSKYTTSTSLQ